MIVLAFLCSLMVIAFAPGLTGFAERIPGESPVLFHQRSFFELYRR